MQELLAKSRRLYEVENELRAFEEEALCDQQSIAGRYPAKA